MNNRLLRFMGARTCTLLLWGAFTGLALSVVEIIFAFNLQAFLIKLGIMQTSAAKLPRMLSNIGLSEVLLILAGVGVIRSALQWAQTYLQGASQDELRFLQRKRILTWAYNAPSASSAEVFSLFNARAEAASVAAAGLQTLSTQLISAVLLTINLFWLAPALTASLGAALLMMAPALRWADVRTRRIGESLDTEWERLSRILTTGIKNLLLLQIYGTQGIEETRAQHSLKAHHKHVMDFYQVLGFKVALPQALGIGLVCVVAVVYHRKTATPPGMLVTYLYLFLRLVQFIAAGGQAFSSVSINLAQARGLFEWWEASNAAGSARHIATASPFSGPIGWTLAGVKFGFTESGHSLFDRLSLTIRPGSATVIVGPSGHGKSTLLALLLGGLRPQEGRIDVTIDGASQPLDSAKSSLLASVGYVGAESFLIEGTILDNLLYGLGREPRSEEISEVVAQAECGFIDSLPERLNHRLTDQGQGLSAGQKQRLSLARALLRHPTVLILDEATSNLDSGTEARLVDTLERLKGRMTIVAATHREALFRIADQRIDLGALLTSSPADERDLV